MERREFLTVAGAVAAAYPMRNAEFGMRNELPHGRFRTPHSAFRTAPPQDPTLSREVFARRLARAQQELQARKVDLLIATPGTNYEYLTGYNPGRSERLIALLLPASGDPTIVCPSFEVERIRQHSVVAAMRGWEEQDDPYRLVRQALQEMKLRARAVALESTTAYAVALRLQDTLGGRFVDAAPITDRLRIIKSPEEIALIRQAIDITEAAIAATFAKLTVGASEREVAQLLSGEMRQRGAQGRGLVQFGPSSPPRLGHGMGLDGHEPPYLVEGNATPLEPGMVFTIEPGIYQLGKFGVRIEDDCVMTENGIDVLSHRAAKL